MGFCYNMHDRQKVVLEAAAKLARAKGSPQDLNFCHISIEEPTELPWVSVGQFYNTELCVDRRIVLLCCPYRDATQAYRQQRVDHLTNTAMLFAPVHYGTVTDFKHVNKDGTVTHGDGAHWALCAIDMTNGIINYYDSCPQTSEVYEEVLKEWAAAIALEARTCGVHTQYDWAHGT